MAAFADALKPEKFNGMHFKRCQVKIAGQRRVRASELAGINTVPAFVLPLDRDRAIITLVDSLSLIHI